MSLSDFCSFLDVPPPFFTPALHNPAPTLGRKPRPPMLQIPEITPPPLTPKPHPLFHQPRAPVAVHPAAPAAGQPRRQRQPKIWDLLPTPKAPEESSSCFRPEPTPGFPRRPSDRSVKCYALHVRNRSLCGNQTGLQDSSALKETANPQNEILAKPWNGVTSPRQGVHAIGVPKVLRNLQASFREAAVESADKVNDVNAVNAAQGATGNGHLWKSDEHKKRGGLSVSARFASGGVACTEAADGGKTAPYSEASHKEPEARRWAVTPQAPEIASRAAGIALQGRVMHASETRGMQQEKVQQRRRQIRAYREAPICAADLNELLTAVLGIFSDASSDKSSKSSWLWRLISEEEEEEQEAGEGEGGNAGQQGKAGSGRFGSPAGVLEYIGFDFDDEDEEEKEEG